jgi:hypothetical protein
LAVRIPFAVDKETLAARIQAEGPSVEEDTVVEPFAEAHILVEAHRVDLLEMGFDTVEV